MMIVVGIAGRKRHGKDTLADFAMKCLVESGFKVAKRHFADPLKEECARMLASQLAPVHIPVDRIPDSYYTFLAEMSDPGKKERYRLLLQFWGTEFKRGMVCDSYWIDKMRAQLAADGASGIDVVFVPDMRFPNEAALVKELGGYNVRILRPGIDDGDGHASEHALDDYENWDAVVENESDLNELARKVSVFLGYLAQWTK